jgi:hypothetical protein
MTWTTWNWSQYPVSPVDHPDLKALLAVDGVDHDVPIDVDAVLRGEDAVLVLAGRVHHQHLVLLALHPHRLVERILDGRVVGVDKLALWWTVLHLMG